MKGFEFFLLELVEIGKKGFTTEKNMPLMSDVPFRQHNLTLCMWFSFPGDKFSVYASIWMIPLVRVLIELLIGCHSIDSSLIAATRDLVCWMYLSSLHILAL